MIARSEGQERSVRTSRQLEQPVVRVDVVDVLGRHQLMFDEDRRRHRATMQDVEGQREDLRAAFREVGDRANQPLFQAGGAQPVLRCAFCPMTAQESLRRPPGRRAMRRARSDR